MSSFRYELPARLGLKFPEERGVQKPLRPRAVEADVEFAELDVAPVLRIPLEVANHGRHDDRAADPLKSDFPIEAMQAAGISDIRAR